jgi:hypothetical protein
VLGRLALEMMQKGVVTEEGGESGDLVLQSPELWSAEAENFLKVSSWAPLADIQKVRDVYGPHPNQ